MVSLRNYSHLFLIILFVSFQAQQFSIPLEFTPIKPYMLIVILAIIFIFLRSLSDEKFRLKTVWVDWYFFIFYSYMATCAFRAENLQLAFHLVLGLCILAIAYFVLRVYCYKQNTELLRDLLVVAGKLFFYGSFGWFILGIFLYYGAGFSLSANADEESASYLLGLYMEGESIPRLRGICDSPNNFGMYAVIFAPIILFNRAFVSVFTVVVLIFCVALTLSTTTYAAFMAMLFVWFIHKVFKMKLIVPSTRGVAKLLVLVMLLVGVIAIVLNSSIVDQVNQIVETRLEHAETGSGRWELWEYVLNLVQERPIQGYGLNQSRELLLPLRALKSTHNNILEILLEGGVVALFLYLALLIGCLSAILSKNCKQSRRWMLLAFVGTFVISNANVNVYNESFVLLIALIATVRSYPILLRA